MTSRRRSRCCVAERARVRVAWQPMPAGSSCFVIRRVDTPWALSAGQVSRLTHMGPLTTPRSANRCAARCRHRARRWPGRAGRSGRARSWSSRRRSPPGAHAAPAPPPARAARHVRCRRAARPATASAARRGQPGVEAEVHQVHHHLHVALRLHIGAHHAERAERHAVLAEETGNDGVEGLLARLQAIHVVGSRLNSAPRFCKAMPVPGTTTPEPKPW